MSVALHVEIDPDTDLKEAAERISYLSKLTRCEVSCVIGGVRMAWPSGVEASSVQGTLESLSSMNRGFCATRISSLLIGAQKQ